MSEITKIGKAVAIEDLAVGNVLKQLREQWAINHKVKKVSQEKIVIELTKVSWAWNREDLSRLETGHLRLTDTLLTPLCEVYGLDTEQFKTLVSNELQRLKTTVVLPVSDGTPTTATSEPDIASSEEPQTVLRTSLSNVESQPLTDLVRGRDDDIDWLRNAFFPGGEFAVGKKCAITGIGGMGKTTLALEYARRNSHLYTYRLFCVASSLDNLTNSYLKLADILAGDDAEVRRAVQADRNTKEYVPDVISAITGWLQRTPNYLLILDNADIIPLSARQNLANQEPDIEITEWLAGKDLLIEAELEKFLPCPAFLKGHLLLTSRNDIISETVGMVTTKRLEELVPSAAEVFLLERTEKGQKSLLCREEQDALEQIVACLCGLPLALEQAGAYIREKSQLFSIYLSNYKAMSADGFEHNVMATFDPSTLQLRQEEYGIGVLERRKPNLGKYSSTVARTWLISFGAILAESPAAAEAFTFSAFLNPDRCLTELLHIASCIRHDDGTPKLLHLQHFFQGVSRKTEIADRTDNLLEPLTRYSLIKKNIETDSSFRVHRLVQAVRRRTLTDEQWNQLFQISIETSLNALS